MISHWIPPFTRRRGREQAAFCGVWVTEAQYSCEPTCPNCRALLEADAEQLEALRAMPSDPALLVRHVDFDPTGGKPRGGAR